MSNRAPKVLCNLQSHSYSLLGTQLGHLSFMLLCTVWDHGLSLTNKHYGKGDVYFCRLDSKTPPTSPTRIPGSFLMDKEFREHGRGWNHRNLCSDDGLKSSLHTGPVQSVTESKKWLSMVQDLRSSTYVSCGHQYRKRLFEAIMWYWKSLKHEALAE